MGVCDFNMCFTFVLAGWEGTAHDTRIFNEALQRSDHIFFIFNGWLINIMLLMPDIQIPDGANIRYHIPDFRCGHTTAIREPRGPKDKFNYLHSSLRNIIEQTFGVWKAR
uniref:DDE Tnp4 domain-containing protein n=1 Tax=Lactuca sativa TaxID=4236 RepID=A0A9R1UNK2_LACSA|nr:hypothetical protein LSAT_V11C800421790 [Lactuca sativa]